ncbi:MAG: PocR ligand-binding domain-containing protein, partial [Clostridia bacterium]|nr:PocR ligand-binding domain-containing protein [Clostridia bacterium]
MALLFHDAALVELMQDFHILTGMRLVLFDENCTELISYPASTEMFCARLRENPDFDRKCRESDEAAFARCRRSRALHICKCHAGFVEATAPIQEDGRIIGYLMFGQITDNPDRAEVSAQMTELCRQYGITGAIGEQLNRIKYRDERQIRAASKIMDACTGYVRLREIVHPSG